MFFRFAKRAMWPTKVFVPRKPGFWVQPKRGFLMQGVLWGVKIPFRESFAWVFQPFVVKLVVPFWKWCFSMIDFLKKTLRDFGLKSSMCKINFIGLNPWPVDHLLGSILVFRSPWKPPENIGYCSLATGFQRIESHNATQLEERAKKNQGKQRNVFWKPRKVPKHLLLQHAGWNPCLTSQHKLHRSDFNWQVAIGQDRLAHDFYEFGEKLFGTSPKHAWGEIRCLFVVVLYFYSYVLHLFVLGWRERIVIYFMYVFFFWCVFGFVLFRSGSWTDGFDFWFWVAFLGNPSKRGVFCSGQERPFVIVCGNGILWHTHLRNMDCWHQPCT